MFEINKEIKLKTNYLIAIEIGVIDILYKAFVETFS